MSHRSLRLVQKFAVWLLTLAMLTGCSPDMSDDPIPYTPFPEIYLNLTQHIPLKSDGGYIYSNEGGTRGLIIYRKNATTYLAFERNCSYRPNEACATVDVDISGLFMIDPCCSSSFAFSDGSPMGGPAWQPLRQYDTRLEGSDLYITDEIVD